MASVDHDPFAIGWLDRLDTPWPEGVPDPCRRRGWVAVATVSGLSSDDDHTLIVEQLREHKAGHHAET